MTSTRLTPSRRVLEKQLGRPLREVLVEDYGDRSHDEVAAALGISERTLERWMERLGLHRRSVIVPAHDDDRSPATNGQGGNDDGARRDTLAGESAQRARGGA